ncbi:hypothetical protein [Prosthecobacter fluviatilis]|uniref:Uncharacterized protein n=1 Tax=Prosthecobacter fluviatilis TaxID=445931 RepID=A0ABW0KKK6_9BACT
MKWQIASARALEMAAWAMAPFTALATHHAVRLKIAFLHKHQLLVANAEDRTLWADRCWNWVEQHFGWLCVAAVLVPVLCSFVQHLGMRGWWRALVGAAVCAPAFWYAWAVLQIFGKVITPIF